MQLVPLEALGWMHLIHRNSDLLLLVSITSMGLLPLASIYLIETEKFNWLREESPSIRSPEGARYFLRLLFYLAVLFPYLLAVFSTYISVQLIRHQNVWVGAEGRRSRAKAVAFLRLKENTMVLGEKDLVREENETDDPRWKIPCPGLKQNDHTRVVEGDCIICLHQYQVGERIVWSSNPKCIHIYHADCLQAWLEPWDTKGRRCPCCRRAFLK